MTIMSNGASVSSTLTKLSAHSRICSASLYKLPRDYSVHYLGWWMCQGAYQTIAVSASAFAQRKSRRCRRGVGPSRRRERRQISRKIPSKSLAPSPGSSPCHLCQKWLLWVSHVLNETQTMADCLFTKTFAFKRSCLHGDQEYWRADPGWDLENTRPWPR